MAIAASKFKAGSRTTAGKQYALYVDLNDGVGYQFLCNTELNEQFNMSDETFATLCSGGNMEHEPTNIDYSIPINAVLRKSDLTDALYNIAHDINALANINIRLDNTLMDIRKEFKAVINISNIGAAAEALVYVEGTIYNRDGNIDLTKGVPTVPTALLSVADVTDTKATISYTFNLNDGDALLSSIEIFDVQDLTTAVASEAPLIDGSNSVTFDVLTPETTYIAKLMYGTDELQSELFTTIPTV